MLTAEKNLAPQTPPTIGDRPAIPRWPFTISDNGPTIYKPGDNELIIISREVPEADKVPPGSLIIRRPPPPGPQIRI